MMKIKIEDVETACYEIFAMIKEEIGENSEIDILEDFYWHITNEELYKLDAKPEKHSIGSLTDDINEIKRIAAKEYTPVRQNLMKLNALLRYIAEK